MICFPNRFGGAWLLVLFSLSTIVRAEPSDHATSRPNILLIVADDLGFSDPGCFGGEIATPHLDRLAREGTRLTQFYTTGRCCPSRAALLTGFYPHAVGLGHMTIDLGRPGYRGRVTAGVDTIADRLQSAGYRTFLSGKWHLGTDDPTQHGFEEYYGTLVSAKTFWDRDHFLWKSAKETPPPTPNGIDSDDTFYATDAVTDVAIEFLDRSDTTPDRPWFLYLAYNAPHFPLQAPAEDIARYADRYGIGWDRLRERRLAKMKRLDIVPESTELPPRSLYFDWGTDDGERNPAWDTLPAERRADLAQRMAIYAAMVDRMDRNIGRVLADLKRRGELDNTLIIFTSDNGGCAEWDPFGFDIKSGPRNILHTGAELDRMGRPGTFHSVGSGWANASNTPWRLYKHYTHEGGIAVPCIVRPPRKNGDRSGADDNSAGPIDSTPTHLIDLFPTIMEYAKIPQAAIETRPGQSLRPLLTGEPFPSRDLCFEHEGHRAIRRGRYKLVALRNGPWELYDLATDRTETRDISADHPQRVRELASAWDHWAKRNHVTPLPTDYRVEYVPATDEK